MKTKSLQILTVLACGATLAFAQVARAADAPAAPGAPGEKPHHRPMGDPVEHLTKELNLTTDQQAQVKQIYADAAPARKAVWEDTTLSKEDKMAKMKALHDATNAKINAILTPDQQTKFAQLQQEHGKGHHGKPGQQ